VSLEDDDDSLINVSDRYIDLEGIKEEIKKHPAQLYIPPTIESRFYG